MRYVGNPIEVEAKAIKSVWLGGDGSADLRLVLEDGSEFHPDSGMVARMTPKPGDYVVIQSDGYVYLNPKAVFERKYSTAGPSIGWAVRQMREGKRLRRKAWDAEVYVAYQPGYPDGVAINANTARATGLPAGTVCKFMPYIMEQIEPGVFIPWVCTQADLLASDWEVQP